MSIFEGKKDYFALAFSDNQIQFAQGDRRGNLKTYAKLDLPVGIIERGSIKNKEGLLEIVTKLLGSLKPKQKFVVVGLPEVKAFTKTLTLPFLPNEELNDAACWEVEPLLPFPLEKAYLDWMILEKTGKKVRVLVVALPQILVENYAEVLEELGFQPIAFEITSLSLARLVEKDGIATMIIEVKEKEALVVVVGQGGGIEISSTVFFPEGKEVETELSTTVDSLLHFYQKKVEKKDGNKKIAKIIVCGPGAKAEWIGVLEGKTGIKTELLATKQAQLASVVSLAQKDVAAPIDEKTINLIPPRIQGLYDRASRVRTISSWLKFFLFCFLLTFFVYALAATQVYFETKRIEDKIVRLQASIPVSAAEVEKEAKALNARAQKIISLAGKQKDIVSLFSLIRENRVEGIEISHYAFDGEKNLFFVDGLAKARNDLLDFQEKLEKTGRFQEVYLPLSSLGREENISFSLTIAN